MVLFVYNNALRIKSMCLKTLQIALIVRFYSLTGWSVGLGIDQFFQYDICIDTK